jgi:lipopolysaccharide transport system ATP-binding protein
MAYTAIETERISKRYRLGQYAGARPAYGRASDRTLRDALGRMWRSPLRRRRSHRTGGSSPGEEWLWALEEVSFEVSAGESVGVIGRNGAGKSTLLKILSRITSPTSGRAVVRGRMGSLLEVGTGFHPELTGRENIYLSGTILGMSRLSIKTKFDDIVDFAGLARFIDTPVKRYSTGMWVRLGFAVAAHLEPDILLIDEVLAVGDVSFQKRCLGKMGDVVRQGRTVVFVSHNLGAVSSLCRRAVLIEGGRVAAAGSPTEVIRKYLSTGTRSGSGEIIWSAQDRPSSEEIELLSLRLVGEGGGVRSSFDVNTRIQAEIDYRIKRPVRGMRIKLALVTTQGEIAFMSTDSDKRSAGARPGVCRSTCTIPPALLNVGRYVVCVGADIPGVSVPVPLREYLVLNTTGPGNHGCTYPETWPGVVCPRLEWRVDRPVDLEAARDRTAEETACG